jgi:hypothetical protein
VYFADDSAGRISPPIVGEHAVTLRGSLISVTEQAL